MSKTILNYILFRDLENKDLSLFRILMSMLGTISFTIISYGKSHEIISNGVKFFSIELLWFYLFIIVLIIYRKKITKKIAVKIVMGFFSLFSNLFLNVWILLIMFLLIGLPVEILKYAINSHILNLISTTLTTAEHLTDYIVGTIFYMQFFVLLYTLSKLTGKKSITSSPQ